ncbi:MAG: c-type cytochrome [Bacteroidia bacterium]
MKKLQYFVLFIFLGSLLWFSLDRLDQKNADSLNTAFSDTSEYWYPPRLTKLDSSELSKQIYYGLELIQHTSRYFGPRGTISATSNGMNCQSCHLDGGTKIWGNNYGDVFSKFPKYRDRSGQKESISSRVNDCFERSLNGDAIDTTGKEMNAIVAYISWLGANVSKEHKAKGSGITKLEFLDRAADPIKGKTIYLEKCKSCHAANGEGLMNADQTEYTYPPLWGENSYNTKAGLYRLSRLAGYVKSNMPNGSSFAFPLISDEDAWDVAAYINTQPRPSKEFPQDWPNIAKKPIDHPFGPFADNFSELQHKLGPFKPIVKSKKK